MLRILVSDLLWGPKKSLVMAGSKPAAKTKKPAAKAGKPPAAAERPPEAPQGAYYVDDGVLGSDLVKKSAILSTVRT